MTAGPVGVVIPLYNHARYVGAAIRSVLEQTVAPRRLLVIDDGSTDRSAEAAREAGAHRVELFTQPNMGAHAAIGRGIELATDCEFIAILNSDDLYRPRRIERCLDRLAREPGADVVVTRLETIGEEGAPLPADHPRARWFDAAWSLVRSDLTPAECLGIANFAGTTSNLFARRAWLCAHPFRSYRFGHDYFALARAAIEGRLAILDEPLLAYRVHGANTITTEPARLVREMLELNLDLIRQTAAESAVDPALRARFTGYLRALWSNVSAGRADLLVHVLARLAQAADPDAIARLVAEAARFPEAREYPNRALVNAHRGATSLGIHSGLADKYEETRARCAALRAELDALRALLRLRSRLARSRWVALGAWLGPARDLARDPPAIDPAARLAELERRIDRSPWIRLGRRLGIGLAPAAADPRPREDAGGDNP